MLVRKKGREGAMDIRVNKSSYNGPIQLMLINNSISNCIKSYLSSIKDFRVDAISTHAHQKSKEWELLTFYR